jgi:hypothetical protein
MKSTLYNFRLYNPSQTSYITLESSDYVHEKSCGLGLPEIVRFHDQAPLQHGSIDRGFRLAPRRVTFKIKLKATTPAEYYTRRRELIDLLRPNLNLTPNQLRIILPDSTQWTLNCFCFEQPTFTDLGGLIQLVEFTLLAPDPTYTQNTSTATFTISGTGIKDLAYSGGWLCHPYPFTIYGPIIHPVITNITSGDKIDLDYTIPDGSTVSIDLRYGYKTVKLNGSTSLLQYLSYDSDLDTWALLPQPDAPDGINTIHFQGSGGGSNTKLTLTWLPTRIGL